MVGVAGTLAYAVIAHEGHDHGDSMMRHWTWDPLLIAVLFAMAVTYAMGVFRLWQRAGAGHGIKRFEVASFSAGMVTLVIALLSPLDWASDTGFSAHMTQHELLMVVAAPLIVMGRTLVAFLWALPEGPRQAVAERLKRPVSHSLWRSVSHPVVVLLVHGAVVWLWHLPVFFEAALANAWVHAFQHLTFFVTAALFFWSLVYGRYGKLGYGLAVLFVFATATHTSVLGALITCARAVLYPRHAARTLAAAVDPLRDQQLAGLIMWIPAGVAFLVIALALFAAWLGESERRAKRAAALSVIAFLVASSACGNENVARAEALTQGNARRGIAHMQAYGCAGCHDIPGVPAARGNVGPPLEHMATRSFIAGKLENTPTNLVTWIMHPQMIVPGNAMPDLGVEEQHAKDMAAYLYTLL